MILTHSEILNQIKKGTIKIEPFDIKNLGTNSYDIHLGKYLSEYVDTVLDAKVIKVPKTYPAYFGSYSEFNQIRNFTDTIENLFLVGRNGMHKYNNQDHSMLTAMQAVQNIINNDTDKSNIWFINTEEEYHEQK